MQKGEAIMKKLRILSIIILFIFLLQTSVGAEGYYVRTCIIDDVVTTIYYLSGVPEDVENYTYITREELDRMGSSEIETETTIKTSETDAVNIVGKTTADVTEIVEYDITYSLVSGDTLNMDISYNIYNGNTDSKSVTLIAVLYNGNRLCDFKTEVLNVDSQLNTTSNITLPLPDNNENCSVKLMAWDSLGTLKPIGNTKQVVDLDSYSREKFLNISSGSNKEFNIYMNAVTVKGENSDAIHTLQYDKTKIIPVDLCGFTYEKELTSGTIDNTDVIIESVDLQSGKIQFRFVLKNGRNTGITNFIKFKALSDITDEQITYTIQ